MTGAAAVIAAVGTIYLGLIRDDKGSGETAPTPPPESTATSKRVAPTEWPSVGAETFTDVPSIWTEGSFPSESLRLDLRIVEGKYRWDLLTHKKYTTRWIESPHGSVVDFYTAVDARLVASTTKDPLLSLLFGKVSNKDYAFSIARSSAGTYLGLNRFDGTKFEDLIAWTSTQTKMEDVNRLAVLVENSTIKLFLNSSLVGEYRDPLFTGGKIALAVGAFSAGSVVVDFDNFELRRRPE
ncbi:MAG: hypothetical protein LC776_16715 [Acidobacteria bacterium]|nr:hypothetical protein [Acidobacteriota bacterium]